MTKIKIITGIDPKTRLPSYAYVHPFLVGKRRNEVRVPTTLVTRKTEKEREGFTVVPREAQIPVRPKTQAKEIKRYANR